MMKQKLPSNWITLNSKSHPDRIYYFNVKTKQSSWTLPKLDENDMATPVNENDKNHREGKGRQTSKSSTLKRKRVENETVCEQQSSEKILETPQMKEIRERMHQKSIAKNKSSLSKSLTKAETRTVILKETSKLTKNNDLVLSLDKNYNEISTFTPQMSVLYEKIQQRNLNKSPDKKLKTTAKNKQDNQVLIKLQRTREKSARHQVMVNQNNNVEQCPNKIQNAEISHSQNISRRKQPKLSQKIILSKDRMNGIKKRININNNINKGKAKEIVHTLINEKAPKSLDNSLPNFYNNRSLESTSVYKNIEVRLTRLHNKILKDVVHKNSITDKSDGDKSPSRQNNELVADNMTKEKLIEQAKREILYEEMDWEPMNDDDIAQQVEVVRTRLGNNDQEEKTNCTSENTVELITHNGTDSQEKKPLYIVVDTNVFLSNLQIIEEARDATFKNYPRPFIVIPWTVIHELDYIKNNKYSHELWVKARKAISFINDQFSSKHPRVVGQTREQAAKNKKDFSLSCPDDEILQCCLQICQLQKSVVLLSYDKNLCNKAMIYDILALGRNDPLEKIDYCSVNDKIVNDLNNYCTEKSIFKDELQLTDGVFEDTKTILKNFLSTIIIKQMSEIYGEAEWKIYVIIKPPWTLPAALKCAIKHWIAAINESFKRHAEYILKELLQDFKYLPIGGRKLEDVERILENCSDLVQATNADKHSKLITETFNAITELKKKCRRYIIDIQQKKLHDKIGITNDVHEQEMRAEKVFQCFQHIYNYARDVCGTACSNAGIVHSFNFEPLHPPLSPETIEYMRPELSRKVADLTQNLNKLLLQAENSNIKYQALFSLLQSLTTFLPNIDEIAADVIPLDVYYCIKLKEEPLKTGLKQLQDLTSHFCALAVHK